MQRTGHTHGTNKYNAGAMIDSSVITTVPSVSYQSIWFVGVGNGGTHGVLQLMSPPGRLQSTRCQGGQIMQAIRISAQFFGPEHQFLKNNYQWTTLY